MFNVLLAFVVASAALAASPDVVATRLDGTKVAGKLREWRQAHLIIRTDRDGVRLPTDQLLALQLEQKQVAPNTEPYNSPHIELTDGTIIPMLDVRATSPSIKVTSVVSSKLGGQAVTVARTQVASLLLAPLSDVTSKQWSEIRNSDATSDLLVVVNRNGQSLDDVDGVFSGISADKIQFKIDGDVMQIDRKKVAGVILYSSRRDVAPGPVSVVRGESRLRLTAADVELDGAFVRFTTLAGVRLAWPLDDIQSVDFSAGKLLYLSDLDPVIEEWKPLVGVPSSAPLLKEYGKPRRDQSAYGTPLALVGGNTDSAIGNSQTYAKGLAIRSRTELVYRLPDGYRRFTALAGIDPAASASGNVRLQVFGADRELLNQEIDGHEPPRPIDLDVEHVRRLKIIVDFGRNLDAGDWLNLCDARLTK